MSRVDLKMRKTELTKTFVEIELPLIKTIKMMFDYYIRSRIGAVKIGSIKLVDEKLMRGKTLMIVKAIFLQQVYSFSPLAQKALENSCKNRVTIIDVGANIGVSTAYFRSKYPCINIISIEASPRNFMLLKNNIAINNFLKVELINSFIGRKTGKINFYHNISSPGGSFGEGFKRKGTSELQKFVVSQQRLSDIVRNLQNIIIKIDVEGAEFEILDDLASSKNINQVIEIIAEVSIFTQQNFNALNSILKKFNTLGFEPRFISDYTVSLLKQGVKQGHMQLSLIRGTLS